MSQKTIFSEKKKISSQKFDWPRFLRMVAAIAVPVALQNLLTTTGSMIDTIMLARLGEKTVGAVGLCAQFSSLFFAGYWGFIGAGTLFVSQYWGADDGDGIRRSYGITLSFVMAVGLLFGIAAVFFPEVIMGIYTDKPQIQEIGIRYLRIVGFSYPLQSLAITMSMTLRSTEQVRIPLIGAITAVVSNCCINYVLIFGKLGLPALGVRGAAVGTVCSLLINNLVMIVLCRRRHVPYILEFTRIFHWNRPAVKLFLQKCFPILCNEMAMGVSNMMINIVLGRQSEEAIAAIAVYRTIEGIVIAFFSGFSSASAVLVGKDVGAGRHEDGFQKAWRMIYLCVGATAIVGVGIMLLHTPLFTAMGLHDESFRICTYLCTVYCIVAVIRMGNWASNDTFRAAGDPAFGSILEITFMYAMVIPLVYLTNFAFKAPFFVVFLFVYCDEPIRFIIMQRHMYSGKWIRPISEEGERTIDAFRESRGIHMKQSRKSQKS